MSRIRSNTEAVKAHSDRYELLRLEFWKLHAKEGKYDGPDSIMQLLNTRGETVEIPQDEKLNIVAHLNQSTAGSSATIYAGSLPLTRQSQSPCIAVTASPLWITGGYHLPKHNPSFRRFCQEHALISGVSVCAEKDLGMKEGTTMIDRWTAGSGSPSMRVADYHHLRDESSYDGEHGGENEVDNGDGYQSSSNSAI